MLHSQGKPRVLEGLKGTGGRAYLQSRSEVATGPSRNKAAGDDSPALLKKQGGLPLTRTVQARGRTASNPLREAELRGLGRHRRDAVTFLSHAVCCNKWKCLGQRRASCENPSGGDEVDSTGEGELFWSRGTGCSPASSGLGSPSQGSVGSEGSEGLRWLFPACW